MERDYLQMNTIEIQYHFNRLIKMAEIKGFKYTFDYLLNISLYNSNLISEKILFPIFPKSVFYPRFIEIEVSTYCNLRCKMCEHTYWREKQQHMSFNQLQSIVNQFPNLKWIGLTGIGESFLNPEFKKMVEFVKDKKLYLELYDNFYLINKNFAEMLVKTGVDRMIVSLDAATASTYRKLRPGSDFNRVIKNIKNLRLVKKSSKAYYPEIIFHYIISKDNIHEVLPYISLVKKLMCKESTSILFTGVLHAFPEIKNMVVEVPDKLVNEANAKCEKLGIKVAWNRNIGEAVDPIIKCNEWTMPFIFVDGTVIPCCATNEANKRKYQIKTGMGNIFKEPFKKIWYGSKYKSLRKMIHEGKTPAACKHCTIYKV